ncbi:lipopolysaccharide N-acetylmannosaminouronosyltransferase [Actinobacillus genomosp. 2]|uniref:lipopolysaccharide N-acetylmannosaminouronosyltransferase n=1 Tax=Actinobacillus genomosp. 2 TaxID=230709 RepID=UPI002441ED73|nr:lipopolysaccharide N-acetylmannosaminouronosyltransferase [Actinobacillus genomosp. 2]WGE31806.1 lipopolysaccharide N-acetylmannosaminouronosyltransferase [Actinobacillus genomosp. 2]
MIETVEIRGLKILTARNKAELVDFLMNEQQIKTGKLIAMNAEKLVMSEKKPEIRQLLKQAEYKYADGISMVRSVKRKYPHIKQMERIAGVDLWEALMHKAGELGTPVFLIGSTADTLAKVQQKLTAWNVNIVGLQDGYFDNKEQQFIIERIKRSGAKLVTVAMGSPKQEQFIVNMEREYPNCLYMGVGGTYDVFTSKVKRAPKIWQDLGLEWLYRLLSQPTRWRRQVNLLCFMYYYCIKQL